MKTTYATLKPDMARAYRDKLKWMTRRVMVPQPPDWAEKSYIDDDKNVVVFDGKSRPDGVHYKRSLKYGKHDDQLILGTTWSVPKEYDNLKPTELPVGHLAGLPVMTTSETGAAFNPIPIWSYFDSDEKPEGYGKLRPARFLPNKLRDRMPRETLKIVRAERVQKISSADAMDEGVGEILMDTNHPLRRRTYNDHGHWTGNEKLDADGPYAGAVDAFAALWNSINAGRGYSWDSNPWVWVLGW
jgi:hypothetical protein